MKSRRLAILSLLLATAVVFTLAWLSFRERARASFGRVPCASNLRQLGQAARSYAMDFDGAFPRDLDDIAAYAPELRPAVFVCPDDAEATPGAPPFVLGRNTSYVWLGEGLTDAVGSRVVIAHCSPAFHGGEGTHVLFADGSVRYVSNAELRELLNAAQTPASADD
jgi:prepilin-type processing-associated H-X9-DG protein